MRYAFKIFLFVLFLASIINAQDLSREQKLKKIEELNNQIKTLERDVILPSAKDLEQAQKQGFNVFRIMPREIYDGDLTIRGGAAYYSFTKKEHSYNSIPQIELSQKSLSVGFAGADYGFIANLGEISLAGVSKETLEVNFLANYKPPTNEPEVRLEKLKTRDYNVDGIIYKRNLPAIVGHAYVLRAISFDDADILVAFRIHRKDTDGSLIIFWKLLETFEIPHLERNETTINVPQVSPNEVGVLDYVMTQALQSAFEQKGFKDISAEATTTEVTLRGTVPKGKMVEAVRITHETAKRKIKNQLTEQ
jgi:hypothetical protein